MNLSSKGEHIGTLSERSGIIPLRNIVRSGILACATALSIVVVAPDRADAKDVPQAIEIADGEIDLSEFSYDEMQYFGWQIPHIQFKKVDDDIMFDDFEVIISGHSFGEVDMQHPGSILVTKMLDDLPVGESIFLLLTPNLTKKVIAFDIEGIKYELCNLLYGADKSQLKSEAEFEKMKEKNPTLLRGKTKPDRSNWEAYVVVRADFDERAKRELQRQKDARKQARRDFQKSTIESSFGLSVGLDDALFTRVEGNGAFEKNFYVDNKADRLDSLDLYDDYTFNPPTSFDGVKILRGAPDGKPDKEVSFADRTNFIGSLRITSDMSQKDVHDFFEAWEHSAAQEAYERSIDIAKKGGYRKVFVTTAIVCEKSGVVLSSANFDLSGSLDGDYTQMGVGAAGPLKKLGNLLAGAFLSGGSGTIKGGLKGSGKSGTSVDDFYSFGAIAYFYK